MSTSSKGAVISLAGRIKLQSAKAICFVCDPELVEFETIAQEQENTKGIWFPFSQVNEIHTAAPEEIGSLDRIVVTSWIAKQKGIIS